MTLHDIGMQVVDFVRAHQAWAAPITFALAFGESLAVISLFVPATIALVGIGALIGASGIDFVPIWLAAALGATFGDWLSYWVGHTFKDSIARMWPLSRYPTFIPRGEEFLKRFGVMAVFIGRFFGPVRAAIPLVAGIFLMPFWHFQIANVTSALLWAAVLLAPGKLGMEFLQQWL